MRTPARVSLLMLAPAALLLALVTLYPLGRSLILSFFETDYGFAGATFVGADNYTHLFGDRFFLRAIRNTVVFTLTATVSEVMLGVGLAVLLNRTFPGRRFLVPLLVAPFVLSTMVVTAIWSAWFHFDYGYLNNLLAAGGLPRVPWLFDRDIALFSIVLVDLWQTTPIVLLIVLAGLQAIDPDVVDAARMDGAGPFQILRSITIPLILPHILLAALMRSIESFKIFDKVYALTGGGPGTATETLSMYLYRLGFRFFDIGLASATAMIMVAIAGALAAVYALGILRRSDA